MYFHHNQRLGWISIAKNACRSWEQVFDSLGWVKQDLYQPEVDVSQLEFFGFLRWPTRRHTMGVVEYLERTQQLHLLDNPETARLLVSAVFDQHSYPVTQMIPPAILARTRFFIIDQLNYNYESLVKNYLHAHGIALATPVPRVNYTTADNQHHANSPGRPTTYPARIQLDQLKQHYSDQHAALEKNFLGADIALYQQHLQQQALWDQPGDAQASATADAIYPWLRAVN